MPPGDLNEASDDEDFSWSEYLIENDAKAALPSCFCQALIPPENKFQVDHKLETFDPRNTTSTCLGTIIETSGPRIRLRLDGTDDRNDFWLMVDSDLIHSYGHSLKINRKIQPPLGFGNDLSKWPKFLEKIIQSSDEKVFAGEECFKPSPPKPLKNEFKVMQKIEAVDPKNPHLICPATIKEIKRDKILITFDGWGQSSQCWYSFTSRDIFPVGWCKLAKHILQYPGDIVEKKPSLNASNNHSKTNNQEISAKVIKTPTVTTSKINTNPKPKKTKATKLSRTATTPKPTPPTTQDNQNISLENSSFNLTVDTTANNQMTNNNTLHSPTTKPTHTNQVSTPNTNLKPKLSTIDLSIVKQEALDNSNIDDSNLHLKNVNLNSNMEINTNYSLNTSNCKNKGATNEKAYVHLIPNGGCGPFIKTEKFHSSHTKFGPGTASSVYKSIIQSFVDCALNRYEVFQMIPEGTSADIVRLKNTNYNERKRLISVECISDMWSNLKSFCKLLEIDDEKLFSRQITAPPATNLLTENEKPRLQNENSRDPSIKSPTKNDQRPPSKVPSKQTSIQNPAALANPVKSTSCNGKDSNNIPSNSQITSLKSISQKRSSTNNINENNHTSDENLFSHGQSAAKIARLDTPMPQLPTPEWSVEQVVTYISELHDNYFVSYVDAFKNQEIDGKALILLTTDILMKYMGFKLGPALKLNNYIDKLRKNLINLNGANTVSQKVKTEC